MKKLEKYTIDYRLYFDCRRKDRMIRAVEYLQDLFPRLQEQCRTNDETNGCKIRAEKN